MGMGVPTSSFQHQVKFLWVRATHTTEGLFTEGYCRRELPSPQGILVPPWKIFSSKTTCNVVQCGSLWVVLGIVNIVSYADSVQMLSGQGVCFAAVPSQLHDQFSPCPSGVGAGERLTPSSIYKTFREWWTPVANLMPLKKRL